MIETPYLLFLGDAPDMLAAKVAIGIRDWRPDNAVGQFRLPGCGADLGLTDMTLAEAKAAGAKTLVIGVANRGGVISKAWKKVLVTAMEEGFDLAAGLHNLLRDEPDLRAVAEATGRKLHDVRVPEVKYPIADGRTPRRQAVPARGHGLLGRQDVYSHGDGRRDACPRHEGHLPPDRADGHPDHRRRCAARCGGGGFHGGRRRMADTDNDPDHWDLIEGQGSLFHVSYSGVTLALVHGGQPDALILCHEPTRTHMRGLPDYSLPSLQQLRDTALPLARISNPACEVVGIAVNTQHMDEAEARAYLESVESDMGLPATDPYRFGSAKLVDALAAI